MKNTRLTVILFLGVLISISRSSLASSQNDIEQTKRELVVEQKHIGAEDSSEDIGPLYRAGIFKGGPYKGYDLFFATYEIQEPCKGGPCPEAHVRFARKGQELVYLRNLSWENTGLTIPQSFQKIGFKVKEDSDYSNPLYSYPAKLTGPGQGQTIEFVIEQVRQFDPNGLQKVFHDQALGDIYSTQDATPETLPMVGDTRRTWTYYHNDFFAFRPDGTLLEYRYYPHIEKRKIRWKGKTNQSDMTEGASYVDRLDPCEPVTGEKVGPDIVSQSEVNADRDLVQIGEIEDRGPIFTYKNSDDPFFKKLYGDSKPNDSSTSYQIFLASNPVFFWRDPFGRLERFIVASYRPPCMAEPILYFYPERSQFLEVRVNDKGHVVASEPQYKGGWHLHAEPSGILTDIADSKKYKHLFWEGWSSIFEMPRHGYVIEQAQVAEFFNSMLPKLGLNHNEAADFVHAWLPRFKEAPYYFITFVKSEDIDRLAPLHVAPKPDTVIRVLMDYKPLDKPIAVTVPDIPQPPKRKGFTVIEWGGLTRR